MQLSASLSCVIFPEHAIVGFKVSFMVTVKEQLSLLPDASVTKYQLVVIPTGNADPETNPDFSVVTDPVQLSIPTGVA